jgi:hypothetical protein
MTKEKGPHWKSILPCLLPAILLSVKNVITGLSKIIKPFVMKTAIGILMMCAVLPAFAADPPAGNAGKDSPPNGSEYSLVRQENDISIYTRWIPVNDTRSARQVKVTFSVPADIEKALSVIRDDGSFTSWMKGTSDYHRIRTVDEENWYSYILFSIPWPLNDQDCIIRYHLHRHSSTQFEISLSGEPGCIQPVKGVKRISHLQGSWKFVEVSPSKTLVEYVIFSNQPSSFPRWITDPIIQKNMVQTMTAFREHIAKH